jgi:hypothetical protein
MSDRLAALMHAARDQMPATERSHEEKMVEALRRALEATTPERPGCPWDPLPEDAAPEEQEVWIPEGD